MGRRCPRAEHRGERAMQARAKRATPVGTTEKLMLDNRYHNLFARTSIDVTCWVGAKLRDYLLSWHTAASLIRRVRRSVVPTHANTRRVHQRNGFTIIVMRMGVGVLIT